MLKSRIFTGALVVGSVAIASLFAAAPANAATLPDGQKITIVDQDDFQFYQASPVSADVTPVGAAVVIDGCVSGIDVDDDGHGYALANRVTRDCAVGDSAPLAALWDADANTGLLSDGKAISVDIGGEDPVLADSCDGIDYSAGVIRATCFRSPSGEPAEVYIGTIDPATGILTPDVTLSTDSDNGFAYHYLIALALDPVTGTLYGFSWDDGGFVGGVYDVWTIDNATGLTHVTELEQIPYGADFDRGGQLWITTIIEQGEDPLLYMALATVDLTDGSNPFLAQYTTPDSEFVDWVEGITVWGKEALPATGPTDLSIPAVTAALLLITGTILAGVTVLRRRSEPEAL